MAACSYCPVTHHLSPFLGMPLRRLEIPSRRPSSQSMCSPSKITAIFWGPKRTAETHDLNPSLDSFTLIGSALEGLSPCETKPQKISLSVVSSISEIPSKDWDACAIDATGPEKLNPFLTHAFLASLEESGSAVKGTGWLPQHVVAQDEFKNIIVIHMGNLFSIILGLMLTTDMGLNTTQSCNPVCHLHLTSKFQLSSLHVTFSSEIEWNKMKSDGFLQRIGLQYHWKNRNYKNFDEFLMDMKQSKRKNIRQERKKISVQGLKMKRLRGDEIKAKHWDSFYNFYRNTTDNKWGRAFLTKDFFHNMGSRMGDRVLLIVAEDGDELVAGALNLIGGDTLFGRLWGCLPHVYYPSLHFEACYYQAIEAAIELSLTKVEAGAQGEHKIQRGYLPVTTYSCHYILDDGFRKAIEEFLVHERNQVKHVIKLLLDSGPFKEGIE